MSAPRELSKTKLSLYLRTQCDRELYLSLFNGNAAALKTAGIPIPLKSRPNVQLVTGAGQDFEKDQYKMLSTRMAGHVYHAPNFGPTDLANVLAACTTPSFCIQPTIEVEDFRATFLSNMGLTPAEQSIIPKLSGMRPDLVAIRDPLPDDWEVLPSGNRQRLEPSDARKSLSVIDLKNVSEANASYAAEVCLYAVVLSNWLIHTGLDKRFYVSAQVYMWTRPELTNFNDYCSKNPTASSGQLVHELLRELERDAIDFLQFIPSVRKFFKEDVPRVITKGDASGWAALDYHVGSRCNACDWLGYRAWLSKADESVYLANPTHYCVPRAEKTNHLSRVPNLSRGARQVLEANGVTDVPSLKTLSANSPVLTLHSFLKRERRTLALKADAIVNSTQSADSTARIVTLARDAALQIHVTVMFDASAGRLTGLGFHASFLPPFGSGGSPVQLARKGYLVARDTDVAEWGVIQSFIDAIVAAVDVAASKLDPSGKQRPKAQIYFWEARQYEELCKAFGRHLANILSMRTTRQQALAWLFPPEDLLEREDGAISPAIVFVQDIVERVLSLPVTHVNTLLRVAAHYHHPSLAPAPIDTFYSEPFSNGIPRERTFEIWMNTSGMVNWGSVAISLSDAMDRYRRVLADGAFALNSVVARLRADFKGAIRGEARPLKLSTVSGKAGVAFDSKMWFQWKQLDIATRGIEAAAAMASAGERLESTYKAIVLTRVRKHLGGHRYEFEVSKESLEAKIDAPNFYLTIGLMHQPGFPLETGYSLGLMSFSPAIPPKQLALAMHKVVRGSLEQFDRVNQIAVVNLAPSWSGVQQVFDAVLSTGVVDPTKHQLFLVETTPYNDSAIIERVLEEIGDPSNATPDVNAIRALGKVGKSIKTGTGSPTKASTVLWQAGSEAKKAVRSAAAASAIAKDANSFASHGLNASQRQAVEAAARHALSVIWGPPGTGKTDTLTAFVHALIREAITTKVPRKILLTGPNYRTIELLASRLCDSLSSDTSATCDLFRAYSKSQELPAALALPPHVGGGDCSLTPGGQNYAKLHNSLASNDRVTVVATTAHSVDKVAALLDDTRALVPAFDVVVIDESSQVDVNLALRPIAALKPEGQLVVAGDHLQMPPIAIVDPPLNAEYLVGSIQTYFLTRFNIQSNPLLENYRSNQQIVEYALSLGYPAGLKAHEPDRKLHELIPRAAVLATLPPGLAVSPAWELLLDPARPVCCLIHEDDTSSQANAAEAKMVAALIYGLHGSMSGQLDPAPTGMVHAPMNLDELFTKGVGVVTPHKAQRAAVISELLALYPGVSRDLLGGAVDTVERFQGGERHTIIVSFGVGDIEVIQGEEEFLLQLERINVAVSRAMAKCIVLLPKSLAYHLPSERKVLKTAKAIKSYIEEFCFKRDKATITIDATVRSCDVRWH